MLDHWPCRWCGNPYREHSAGNFYMPVERAAPCPVVECLGSLGVWQVPPDVLGRLEQVVRGEHG